MLRVRRRKGRGYTLLEIAITLLLTLALIAILMRWITSLVEVTQSSSEVNKLQGTLSVLDSTLREDTEDARVCSDSGMGTALRAAAPTSVQIYRDVDRDGSTDLVVWKIEDSQALRAVLPGDGSCNFSEESVSGASFNVVASGVSPNEREPLTGVREGDSVELSENCQESVEACKLDALRLDVNVTGEGNLSAPGTIAKTFPIINYGTRL